jgi:hypothetical protein
MALLGLADEAARDLEASQCADQCIEFDTRMEPGFTWVQHRYMGHVMANWRMTADEASSLLTYLDTCGDWQAVRIDDSQWAHV